ncbi:MAG: DUF6261 family protein [Tannerellaceae bacterium]|jgi:hypothetical protein|nr:DUF6261 family protein [Tannerellaceae bacterium]
MKKVKNYSKVVYVLKNAEHFDFHEYVCDTAKSFLPTIPEMSPTWSALNLLFKEEDVIFKTSARSIETKYIKEAGVKRHDVFMMFSKRVSAGIVSYEKDEKEAATKLKEVLDNYKSINSSPMTETSALITNMLQDLDLPRYSDAVDELEITNVVAKLKAVNDEFREIYMKRAQNLENAEVRGSMTTIRHKVDKALRVFVNDIEMIYISRELSGSKNLADISVLIDNINAIIDQFARILSHRIHPAGKKNDSEPETPVVTVPILSVSHQEIEDAKRMLLLITDRSALAEALYPAALGGEIVLSSENINDYSDFPIVDFEMDGEKPAGLVAGPPMEGLSFKQPLESLGHCRAEVFKGDTLLAILEGVEWPSSEGLL